MRRAPRCKRAAPGRDSDLKYRGRDRGTPHECARRIRRRRRTRLSARPPARTPFWSRGRLPRWMSKSVRHGVAMLRMGAGRLPSNGRAAPLREGRPCVPLLEARSLDRLPRNLRRAGLATTLRTQSNAASPGHRPTPASDAQLLRPSVGQDCAQYGGGRAGDRCPPLNLGGPSQRIVPNAKRWRALRRSLSVNVASAVPLFPASTDQKANWLGRGLIAIH